VRRLFSVDFCFGALGGKDSKLVEFGVPEAGMANVPANLSRRCLDIVVNSRAPISWNDVSGEFGFRSAVVVPVTPPVGQALGFLLPTMLLLVGNQGLLSIRPQLAKVPYDPVKDFAPIVLLVSVPNILVVHPSVPAQSLQELLAYARSNPGKLTYSSQGIGASGHIAAELLKLAAGVDITHVPFRGAAPAAQALAAGHVHMMFDVVSLALGPIQSGTVRAIGVASQERVGVLPDVPTLGEQGFPGEIGAWFGLLAPAGTPPAVRDNFRASPKQFLEQYALMTRLLADANAKKLEDKSPYTEQLEWMHSQVLMQAKLNTYSDSINIGPKEEKEYYENLSTYSPNGIGIFTAVLYLMG
jgi:hypothetical protein